MGAAAVLGFSARPDVDDAPPTRLALDVPGFFEADCKLAKSPEGLAVTDFGLTVAVDAAAGAFAPSLDVLVFLAVVPTLLVAAAPFSLLAAIATFFCGAPSPVPLADRFTPATGSGSARLAVGEPALAVFNTSFVASVVAIFGSAVALETLDKIFFA